VDEAKAGSVAGSRAERIGQARGGDTESEPEGGVTWKSQLADGRVFELRSKSTRYPPPCGLVINADGKSAPNFLRLIDDMGTTGQSYYSRRHNPDIYVEGIRPDQFTSKRIARRRPDLEKFDADDLALIRYGYDLDFDGRITGTCSDISIPLTRPAEWTVFWIPAYADGFPYPHPTEPERKALGGAWHFEGHGGPAHLGYKYGHMHATRHTGKRLDRVRKIMLRELPGMIETPVHVVRYTDKQGRTCVTTEYDGDCAPLGDGRTTLFENAKTGEYSMCCGPREVHVA
jgi:hypothetical protein